MYKLLVDSKVTEKRYDITELTNNTNISFYRKSTASKLEFTIDKDNVAVFNEGDVVYFYDDNKPIIKAYIFAKESNESKKISVNCYDQLRYLKAKQTFEFIGKSLKQIITIIANYFGLNIGYIEDVPYITNYYYHEDESAFDIIDYHVQQSKIMTGKEIVFYDDFGMLTLKYADSMVSNYILGVDSFVDTYNYKTDIDNNTYNIIKLVRPNKDTGKADLYMAKDDNNIKAWGMLQYYEVMDENLNKEQLKEYLKLLFNYHNRKFRTLKLDAIGIPELRGGNTIYIDIPDIGDISINRSLLIDSITHKYTSNSHTMSLEMEVR
ncbi:MAG TPA: hypothetical protein DC000_00125 [Clostridiales bacterium]|nr:hypothetical protein [Clostridiales bacterium]